MKTQYYEHLNGGRTKWWMIAQDGNQTITAWGPTYSYGSRSQIKTYVTDWAAEDAFDSTTYKKQRKGYVKTKSENKWWAEVSECTLKQELESKSAIAAGILNAGDLETIYNQMKSIMGDPSIAVLSTAMYSQYTNAVAEEAVQHKMPAKTKPEPPAPPPGKLVLKHLTRDA